MEDTRTGNNIKVYVQSRFEPDFSRPELPNFIFSYKVKIVNRNPFPVQILKRQWIITDSNGEVIVVDGEGVVGQTPIIEAGKKFEYTSNVNLQSGIGKMKGKYEVLNLNNSSTVYAEIPEFKLEADFVLN